LKTGGVKCWGEMRRSNGLVMDSDHVVLVDGIHDAVRVAVGATHACALTKLGDILCWGSDAQGEAGGRSSGLDFEIALP